MHERHSDRFRWLMPFFILFLFTPLISEASNEMSEEMPKTKQYSEQEVKQKWSEAMEALENYTAARKDETMEKVDDAMQALDARIGELEARSQSEWNEASAAARDQYQHMMVELRRQRNELAEWYGGVKYGSKDAWKEVKQGFGEAYRNVSDSLGKAWRSLKDTEQ